MGSWIDGLQIHLKWYSFILIVVPAMLSAFLVNPKTLAEAGQSSGRRYNRNRVYRNRPLNIFLEIVYFLWQMIITVLCYIAITALAIFFYAIFRYFSLSLRKTDITIWSIWRGFATSYISLHWKEGILIPFVAAITAKGVKSRHWKIFFSVLLVLVLIVSSLLTNSGVSKILPMEDEILAELKSTPVFDHTIYDIDGFQTRINEGYLEVKPESSSEGSNSNDVRERPSELDQDINTLTLDQLIKCMRYLVDITEYGQLRAYTNRAYELYFSGTSASNGDAGYILYYYAWYNDNSIYLDAASKYEAAELYWNALVCLNAYCDSVKDAFVDLTSRMVDDSILAVNNRDNTHYKYCENIIKRWYEHTFEELPVEDFDRLCAGLPDEAFINIVNACMSIQRGIRRNDDASRIEHILSIDKYRNCPKALLLSQYYGNEHLNELYQLYIKHADWFEKEDRMNLAWFFYDRGENKVAISITKDGAEDVLIRTEAFLQAPDDEVDLKTLYIDITNTINDGAGDYEPRLRLAQIIIGNRLGLVTSYEGLSDACREVFDTNSTTGLFIISSLMNADERYEEAYTMTAEILKNISAPDPLYYRTLFLQADTLMGMASMPEFVGEAAEYYERAATILEAIRDSVESDYVSCLKRLVNVYREMGRDDDMNRTLELLANISGEVQAEYHIIH